MNKLIMIMLLSLGATSVAQADTYGSNPHPPVFGPWELYQKIKDHRAFGQPLSSPPYAVDCLYKRYEIQDKTSGSRIVETKIVTIYMPTCPTTIN